MDRICAKCGCSICTGDDFYANRCEGQEADEVFCCVCIDDIVDHELFMMGITEKAELVGYGMYCDEEEKPEIEKPIPGQLDMFGDKDTNEKGLAYGQ